MDIPDEAMRGIRSASEPYANCSQARSASAFPPIGACRKPAPPGRPATRYGDAAGHSCMAVAGLEQSAMTLETGSADRLANMHIFAATALNMLLQNLSR